jgi:hypothetical protein
MVKKITTPSRGRALKNLFPLRLTPCTGSDRKGIPQCMQDHRLAWLRP